MKLAGLVVAAVALVATAPASAVTVTKSDQTAAEVSGGSAQRTVSFNTSDFPASAVVTNVVVVLDFAKIDDTGTGTSPTCGPPPVNGTLNERNDNLGYDLRSPSGTTVSLIAFGTYSSVGFNGRLNMTLDDSAASGQSGVPSTGTFRPSQPLSGFDGQTASGTWTVVPKNNGPQDPVCHYGFDLTLTVEVPNAPPTAGDNAYETAQDTPLVVPPPGVLANDSDPEGAPLTATQNSAPANGALTVNSDGSFTYTPAAGFSGADSFTYRASDGSVSSSAATVSITVTPAPAPTPEPEPTPTPEPIPTPPPICQGREATIVATSGQPTFGTEGSDVIVGTAGPDEIRASGGDDLVCSLEGADEVRAGAGEDSVETGAEADTARGGAGSDAISGQEGNDELRGGKDDDALRGGDGNDRLRGVGGDDALDGETGSNKLYGGGGDDTCANGPTLISC